MNEMIPVKDSAKQAGADVSSFQKDALMSNGGVGKAADQSVVNDNLVGASSFANGLKGSPSEDKTGIELSKQQTFKGNSLVGDDDSSSSDSSSDDSNIFG